MKSKIVWFTGLSGAGKTTLSNHITKKLRKKNYRVKRLDGDLFRKKNNNKKFSRNEIIKNNLSIIRYISEIKHKFDYIVISVISPIKKTRLKAYKKFGKDYFEVYTKCNLKTLIDRDTKKLYEKARKNLIKNLIGFNSKIKYEKTNYKKIVVNTACESVNYSVKKILKKIIL